MFDREGFAIPNETGASVSTPKRAGNDAPAAQGEALASLFLKEVQNQADIFKRFALDLVPLVYEARRAFRSALSKHLKEMRAHVKASGDAPNFKKAMASAVVRVSEITTISHALDAGMKLNKKHPFHTMVAEARVFREAQASGENDANGPTRRRGRKATPVLDKVKNYLNKLELTPAQLEEIAEMVATMAQVEEQ
jgi:hypothetical protein